MAHIFVSGLINIETTVRIDGFPIPYFPVRYDFHGIESSISGVGYNLAKALSNLGDQVHLASLIGKGSSARRILERLEADRIRRTWVLQHIDQTPQSVILYDQEGRRQIHLDLKDIQDRRYPESAYEQAAEGCPLAVLTTINFSRYFLDKAKQSGKLVATDLQALDSLDDAYNLDFMKAGDILFMSHERLPVAPEDWLRQMAGRFSAEIMAVTLGSQGVLFYVRSHQFMERIPAVTPRKVVNTIGAGDALFSCFLHYYVKTHDPYLSIRKAVVYAGYKVGATGAADGLISEPELERLFVHHDPGGPTLPLDADSRAGEGK